MFGLEKKTKKEKFAFDLEEEIENDLEKKKLYLKQAETQMHQLKKDLRAGQDEKYFEQMGVLLHGYSAFVKVIKRIKKKKQGE